MYGTLRFFHVYCGRKRKKGDFSPAKGGKKVVAMKENHKKILEFYGVVSYTHSNVAPYRFRVTIHGAAAICLHLTRLSNANCCRLQKFVGLFAAAQGLSSIL
jgi:hypothetical protein